MIVAAVAEMAAERHVNASVEKRQCAALVLGSRIEPNTARGKPGTNINREAGQHTAIGEPQPVEEMPRFATIIDHRVEEYGTAGSIDDRRSRDAQRIDIAAGQRRPASRLAERCAPDCVTGFRI